MQYNKSKPQTYIFHPIFINVVEAYKEDNEQHILVTYCGVDIDEHNKQFRLTKMDFNLGNLSHDSISSYF